jgi:hypothetical protein
VQARPLPRYTPRHVAGSRVTPIISARRRQCNKNHSPVSQSAGSPPTPRCPKTLTQYQQCCPASDLREASEPATPSRADDSAREGTSRDHPRAMGGAVAGGCCPSRPADRESGRLHIRRNALLAESKARETALRVRVRTYAPPMRVALYRRPSQRSVLGEGDRAAGLALTIQIVGKAITQPAVFRPSLCRQRTRQIGSAQNAKQSPVRCAVSTDFRARRAPSRHEVLCFPNNEQCGASAAARPKRHDALARIELAPAPGWLLRVWEPGGLVARLELSAADRPSQKRDFGRDRLVQRHGRAPATRSGRPLVRVCPTPGRRGTLHNRASHARSTTRRSDSPASC